MSTEFVSTSSLSPEVAHIVAIWTEILLYGVYSCLFFEAMYIMLRKRKESIASAKVFLITTALMYIVATAHALLSLYRLLRGYVWVVEPPAIYFMDFTRWDMIANNATLCIMTWLGDALVIYRCFIVWDYNYYVVILPVILLILELAFNVILLVWFTHLGMVSFDTIMSWMGTIYPLVFAQNVITTGLISFKIWSQHRSSAANGVIDTSSTMNLMHVLRIIVESAAIYTVQLLVLLILYPMQHSAQFIVQAAVVPSIGIVFVLIAVRIHLTKSRTFFNGPSVFADVPNWPEDDGNSAHSGPDSESAGTSSGLMPHTDGEKIRSKVDFAFSPADNLSRV